MDAEKLGKFISGLRKEKHMTQAELAEKLHVTDKAVSRWERGVGLPDIGNIEALADALGVSIVEVMKCERAESREMKREEAEEMVSSAFDLARLERLADRKRKIISVVLAVIGAAFLSGGIYFLTNPVFSTGLSIGGTGADGPTAVFLAGKISPWPPAAAVLAGVFCLGLSLWNMFKEN